METYHKPWHIPASPRVLHAITKYCTNEMSCTWNCTTRHNTCFGLQFSLTSAHCKMYGVHTKCKHCSISRLLHYKLASSRCYIMHRAAWLMESHKQTPCKLCMRRVAWRFESQEVLVRHVPQAPEHNSASADHLQLFAFNHCHQGCSLCCTRVTLCVITCSFSERHLPCRRHCTPDRRIPQLHSGVSARDIWRCTGAQCKLLDLHRIGAHQPVVADLHQKHLCTLCMHHVMHGHP